MLLTWFGILYAIDRILYFHKHGRFIIWGDLMNKRVFICDHCGAKYDEEGNFLEPEDNSILADLEAYREENTRIKADLLRLKETLDLEREKRKGEPENREPENREPENREPENREPEKPKRKGLLNGIFG
jgi:hypothetical protein